jgi:hypothetical protein
VQGGESLDCRPLVLLYYTLQEPLGGCGGENAGRFCKYRGRSHRRWGECGEDSVHTEAVFTGGGGGLREDSANTEAVVTGVGGECGEDSVNTVRSHNRGGRGGG